MSRPRRADYKPGQEVRWAKCRICGVLDFTDEHRVCRYCMAQPDYNRSRKHGRPTPRTCGCGVESSRTDERPTPTRGRPPVVTVSAPDGDRGPTRNQEE